MNRITGKFLNQKWEVGAKHSLYHHDGKFNEHLERFPGAFFDADGFVLFETKEKYRSCSALNFGVKVNVPNGISSIPGYVRMKG